MKGVVVYYSATGNTQKIAKAIHKGMKESIEECDIFPLKEVDSKVLLKYDVIGLGSPIWRGREPVNVQIFIKNMPDLKGKLGFPFCTHGALPIGFMYWVVPALKRKGLTIIGYNDWFGGVRLPYMPNPYLTDGHPDGIDLKEAEEFGNEMAERARRISLGEIRLIPELPQGTEADILWQRRESRSGGPSTLELAREVARQRRKLNKQKCTYPECTICVDTCPMDSIDLLTTPATFRRNCIMCLNCEVLCPTGAIEIDYENIFATTDVQGVPTGPDHPFVKYLNDAEARGRFRWVVPLDEVGFDTLLWKSTGHPRYVVEEE